MVFQGFSRVCRQNKGFRLSKLRLEAFYRFTEETRPLGVPGFIGKQK